MTLTIIDHDERLSELNGDRARLTLRDVLPGARWEVSRPATRALKAARVMETLRSILAGLPTSVESIKLKALRDRVEKELGEKVGKDAWSSALELAIPDRLDGLAPWYREGHSLIHH